MSPPFIGLIGHDDVFRVYFIAELLQDFAYFHAHGEHMAGKIFRHPYDFAFGAKQGAGEVLIIIHNAGVGSPYKRGAHL